MLLSCLLLIIARVYFITCVCVITVLSFSATDWFHLVQRHQSPKRRSPFFLWICVQLKDVANYVPKHSLSWYAYSLLNNFERVFYSIP